MRKTMMRFIATGSIGALLLAASLGTAFAGKPANQGCLGHDVSTSAKAFGSGLGAMVSGLASSTEQGFGDEVQAHAAGLIPDSAVPNTCND